MFRPDWSRPLPRPLTIPTVMKLSTLADVRTWKGKFVLKYFLLRQGGCCQRWRRPKLARSSRVS